MPLRGDGEKILVGDLAFELARAMHGRGDKFNAFITDCGADAIIRHEIFLPNALARTPVAAVQKHIVDDGATVHAGEHVGGP